MTFANIQLPAIYALDPFLAELINKLALDMPAFTFTTKGMSKQDINYNTSKSSIQDRTIVPSEGVEFLRMVRTYKGTEYLGEISIDTRYARSGPTEKIYCIKSWRIDNQRGNANTSTTSKLMGAVRIVKKTFIPMIAAEVIEKANTAIYSSFSGAIRDLMRPISNSTMIPSSTIVQRYIYLLLRGEEIPNEVSELMRKDFLSEKYEKAMLEFMLAEKMTDKHYAVVVQYSNTFLVKRFHADSHAVEYKQFDELPEKAQSALAVLQLMEDSELVDDVGYRYNDRNFYILDSLFAMMHE
jgi:hypothetical protein